MWYEFFQVADDQILVSEAADSDLPELTAEEVNLNLILFSIKIYLGYITIYSNL